MWIDGECKEKGGMWGGGYKEEGGVINLIHGNVQLFTSVKKILYQSTQHLGRIFLYFFLNLSHFSLLSTQNQTKPTIPQQFVVVTINK
jgi:hypothetical protein